MSDDQQLSLGFEDVEAGFAQLSSHRIDDDADLLALKGSWEARGGDHRVVAERECRFDGGVFGDGADQPPRAECSRDRWKRGSQAAGGARDEHGLTAADS